MIKGNNFYYFDDGKSNFYIHKFIFDCYDCFKLSFFTAFINLMGYDFFWLCY